MAGRCALQTAAKWGVGPLSAGSGLWGLAASVRHLDGTVSVGFADRAVI
jgi:hypothetical protein